MTWAKLDDSAPSHPKVLRARPEAAWLWTCGICWSNKHHTDGHIPADMLDGLSPGSWSARRVRELARRLVEVGLWHVDEERGGWTIHDYADHQEPALKVNAERKKEQARERKRRQRAREAEADGHAVTHHVTRDVGVTVTRDGPRDTQRDRPRDVVRDATRDVPRDVVGDVRGDASVDVTPPRPDPTRPGPISPSESDRAPAHDDPEGMTPARVWRALDDAWWEAFGARLPGVWSPLYRSDAAAVLERCGGTSEGVQAEVSGFVRWARGLDALPAEPWRKFFGAIGSWEGRVDGDKHRARAAKKQRERIAAERHLKPSSSGTPSAEETDRALAKVTPRDGEVVPIAEGVASVLSALRGAS